MSIGSEGCAGEPAQLTDEQTVPRAAALARAAVDTVPADRLLLFVVVGAFAHALQIVAETQVVLGIRHTVLHCL